MLVHSFEHSYLYIVFSFRIGPQNGLQIIWRQMIQIEADWSSNKVQPGFLWSKCTSGLSPVILIFLLLFIIFCLNLSDVHLWVHDLSVPCYPKPCMLRKHLDHLKTGKVKKKCHHKQAGLIYLAPPQNRKS